MRRTSRLCHTHLLCLHMKKTVFSVVAILLCSVQSVAYIPPHQPHLTQAMIRWTGATMWAVKSMVRPKSPLKDELQGAHAGNTTKQRTL